MADWNEVHRQARINLLIFIICESIDYDREFAEKIIYDCSIVFSHSEYVEAMSYAKEVLKQCKELNDEKAHSTVH